MGLFSKKRVSTPAPVPFGRPMVPLPTTGRVSVPQASVVSYPRLRLNPGSVVTVSGRPGVVISTYSSGEFKIAVGSDIVRADSQSLQIPLVLAPESKTLQRLLSYLQTPVVGRTLMDDWRAAHQQTPTRVLPVTDGGSQESAQMRAGKRASVTPNNVQHGYADSGSHMSQDEAYRKYFGE